MPCATSEKRFGRRIAAVFLKYLVPLTFLLLTTGFIYARWFDTARIARSRDPNAQSLSADFFLSVSEREAKFFYAALVLAVFLGAIAFRALRKMERLGDELEGLTTKVLHNQSRAFGDIGKEAGAIVSQEDPPTTAARRIETICEVERKKIAAYMRLARDFAGYDKSNMESVNISEAAWRIASEMKATINHVEVKYIPPAEDVIVRAHPFLIFEIIGNLMDNAVKYTESGVVTLSVAKDHGKTKIEVSDTGCGISSADRKRMFERFYRAPSAADKPGSGLGLATVHDIVVNQYKGRITCRSKIGAGTTFTVLLPLAAAP